MAGTGHILRLDECSCVFCCKYTFNTHTHTHTHTGWRFTPKVAGTGDVFYALIVDYAEDKRRSGEAESTRVVLEHLQVVVA